MFGVVILTLVIILLFVQKPTKNNNDNTDTTVEGLIINDDNKFLINDSLSKEDKYLMLLGQQMIENYGTVQLGNVGPLTDLLNQSTPTFSTKVQSIIDTIDINTDVVTTVDTNSLKLERSSASFARIVATAVTANNKTKETNSHQYRVDFVKSGDYWLVENITFSDK